MLKHGVSTQFSDDYLAIDYNVQTLVTLNLNCVSIWILLGQHAAMMYRQRLECANSEIFASQSTEINQQRMDESAPERSILLIDDDRDRAQLIETALQSFQHRVMSITDGIQAIDFLNRRGDYVDAPRPDLILFELNLPGDDGQDLLAKIKADPQLRRIPIVVLTTATSEANIFSTYLLQGNCHVVRSNDLDRLCQIVQRIEEFWFGIVTLPAA